MVSEDAMKAVGGALLAARLSQKRSLDDIATATRISKSSLEDIENGRIPKLPLTYIRAFVKSYAMELGLNPEELLNQLVEEKMPAFDSATKIEGSSQVSAESAFKIVQSPLRRPSRFKSHQTRVLVIVIFVVIAGLVVSVSMLRKNGSSTVEKEISFSDVIKENEQKLKKLAGLGDSTSVDSLSSAPVDTLFLEGTASESVWARIVMDSAGVSDIIMLPKSVKRWKAKKFFNVSIGNSRAVSFVLNGHKLGLLDEGKKSLRNVLIDRTTLSKLIKQGRP